MHARSHEVWQPDAFVAAVKLLHVCDAQIAARQSEGEHGDACRHYSFQHRQAYSQWQDARPLRQCRS